MDEQRPVTGLDPAKLDPLVSLDDATRRRLYEFVVAADEPVTRDQARDALGIDRSLVAYHLDKLLDEGLLVASFARPDGRGGPGAGRPSKHYQRSDREFTVSVPPRDYQLAAELLARAGEADGSGAVRQALHRAAAEFGRVLAGHDGDAATDLFELLARHGFEPYDVGGVVRLRNCPFHKLAQEHTELVCGMNLALLTGMVEASGSSVEAQLDPAPERCCVAFVPPG